MKFDTTKFSWAFSLSVTATFVVYHACRWIAHLIGWLLYKNGIMTIEKALHRSKFISDSFCSSWFPVGDGWSQVHSGGDSGVFGAGIFWRAL